MMNSQTQNSNTQQSQRQRGVASEGGFQFEIKMAAIIGLRGLGKRHDFELYSNIEEAGNFDDLVYKGDGRLYFLQTKHSYDPDRTLEKNEMSKILGKCLKSYRKIKNDKKFKCVTKDNKEFIIFTNRKLDNKLTWRKKEQTNVDIFFKTSENKIFNFNPNKNENGDLYKRLESSVEVSEDPGLKSLIPDFLEKLIIVTDQEGNLKLDNLIADELYKQDKIKVDPEEYNSILHHFKTRLETWWRNEHRVAMTPKELIIWLQKAKTEYYKPVVKNLCESCTKELTVTGIKFSNIEVSRLKIQLTNERAVHLRSVHLRSDALTLCGTLLLDYLNKSNYLFVTFQSLQSNKNMLLHAWLGGHWEWLIVFCDSAVLQSDIADTCIKISEDKKLGQSKKRFIILTSCSVPKIDDFFPIEYKFQFEHLSQETRAKVLDKTIDFQGFEVSMTSVLERHGNVQCVLGPELVTDLITEGTTVKLGGTVQKNEGYYAPRLLKRKIYLHLDVLNDTNLYFEAVAVSGMTKDEILEKSTTLKNVENFSTGGEVKEIQDKIIVLPTENPKKSFSELYNKNQDKTLHWLKYVPKDQIFLWKRSRGATESLLNYVDFERTHGEKAIIREFMKRGSQEVKENSLWGLDERTLLVVAEPGMGKTSTTTQTAQQIKSEDLTSWVVHINWSDHIRELQKINTAKFNFKSLFEFLCSAAFPESKYTYINRILLKQALQKIGNVTVLMDGFDEISSILADKTAVILRELKKSKVKRIWITSRPVQRERLEKELSVTAFTLKKLSHESQEEMLRHICKVRRNKKKRGLEPYDLLREANKSVYHRKLTGYPLNIIMIASALEGKLGTSLKSGKRNLTSKLNLPYLYHTFVERKLYDDATENKRTDLTKDSIQEKREIYLKNLETCSLLVTLPSELNPLRDEKMQTTVQTFLEELQAGKDKICTAMNVVEKRPHFLHRTFADYFTARWFSKNFKANTRVLKHILFDSSYWILKDMFDRILARDCLLHCAVLDRDTEAVEDLLKGGSGVNDLDEGGRTAMHLIAAQGPGDSVCKEITNSLLRRRPAVNTKDKVLNWTPLQYARETGNKYVEQLLSG